MVIDIARPLEVSNYSEKTGVERYLSPVSGSNTTIVLPSFSGLKATLVAAKAAAPEEMPTKRPSILASVLLVAKASSFSTVMISS